MEVHTFYIIIFRFLFNKTMKIRKNLIRTKNNFVKNFNGTSFSLKIKRHNFLDKSTQDMNFWKYIFYINMCTVITLCLKKLNQSIRIIFYKNFVSNFLF